MFIREKFREIFFQIRITAVTSRVFQFLGLNPRPPEQSSPRVWAGFLLIRVNIYTSSLMSDCESESWTN